MRVLAEIVRAALPDYVSLDIEGTHIAAIDKDSPRKHSIKEMTTRRVTHQSGRGEAKEEWETTIADVKLHDPIKAIEAIAKILGWDKRRMDVFLHKAEEMTDAELAEIAKGEE